MKSLMTRAGSFCVAAFCLVVPDSSALVLTPQGTKTGSFVTVPIMFGVAALCLVIGVVLRAFSKPEAELSLNQQRK